jgi:hypothetical protein
MDIDFIESFPPGDVVHPAAAEDTDDKPVAKAKPKRSARKPVTSQEKKLSRAKGKKTHWLDYLKKPLSAMCPDHPPTANSNAALFYLPWKPLRHMLPSRA